jgi:hypothetical protein
MKEEIHRKEGKLPQIKQTEMAHLGTWVLGTDELGAVEQISH